MYGDIYGRVQHIVCVKQFVFISTVRVYDSCVCVSLVISDATANLILFMFMGAASAHAMPIQVSDTADQLHTFRLALSYMSKQQQHQQRHSKVSIIVCN